MDPKELALSFAEKLQIRGKVKDAEAAAAIARRSSRERDQEEAEAALDRIVLPYLDEVKKELGDSFIFEVVRDNSTMKAVGVTFTLDRSKKISINSRFGHLSTVVQGMEQPYNFDCSVVAASDLSREKIGKLINQLILALEA